MYEHMISQSTLIQSRKSFCCVLLKEGTWSDGQLHDGPWQLLCNTHALGNEQPYVSDWPHFAHVCRQVKLLFQDSVGAMQAFLWHPDQNAATCLSMLIISCHSRFGRLLKHGHDLKSQCWLNRCFLPHGLQRTAHCLRPLDQASQVAGAGYESSAAAACEFDGDDDNWQASNIAIHPFRKPQEGLVECNTENAALYMPSSG